MPDWDKLNEKKRNEITLSMAINHTAHSVKFIDTDIGKIEFKREAITRYELYLDIIKSAGL